MSGLIGVIANDAARFSLFMSCMLHLRMPAGARKEILIGGDWCGARNDLVRLALDSGAEWLWFMDDDHAFPPSLLERLLSHGEDKDIVMPVCLTRQPPFPPVQYTEQVSASKYLPIPLSMSPTDGLTEVLAGGCAGMLIRRRVLQSLEEPWFRYADRSEDILFCEAARDAGFRLWCDLGARLGHITTAVVWPAVDGDQWVTGLTIGKNLTLTVNTAEQMQKAQEQEAIATGKPWAWELRRVLTDEVVYRCVLPPMAPIMWKPTTSPPEGMLQWWVNEGDGFHKVGDPYTYFPEAVA